MKRIEIITDVGSDLVAIDGLVLPMEVTFGDEQYLYGTNCALTLEEFYKKLDQFKVAKTSQVTPSMFLGILEPLLKDGADIIYVSLSSKLSGTYDSAIIACNELKEAYPSRRITCIDSKLASTALGALVLESIRKKNEGLSYDDIIYWINSKIGNIPNVFVVDDLDTLKRGGRISNTVSIVGQVLNLKPILHINQSGEIVVIGKARGRSGSIKYFTDFLEDQIINNNFSTLYIGYANNPGYALLLKNSILQKKVNFEIRMIEIGPIIASHAGANTVMIALI
ncbi:MAG: DegV family protein [Firmicutes bacterium]|nr:DegV family protein [Bacillota bacterium]